MTQTLTSTGTATIPELEAALRESKQEEHALALEVDAMPERIRAAAQAHARRLADASRKGKDALREADEQSAVGQLREREAELPYLRWSQTVRSAALAVELNEALGERERQRTQEIRPRLKPVREAADAAQR